jgi:hypothetical protein
MAVYVVESGSDFRVISEGDPVEIGGTQYPSNYPKSEIAGLVPVDDPPTTLSAPASHWQLNKQGDQYVWVKSIADVVLTDFIETIARKIDAYAASLRDQAVTGVSPGELSAWPLKAVQAQLYLATNDLSQAPLIAAEIASSGESPQTAVNRIMQNAVALVRLEGAVAGTDRLHKNAVRALNSFESVQAYDWMTGWPTLIGIPPER